MKNPAPQLALAVNSLRGEVAAAFADVDWESQLEALVDAGSAKETLHWGRNYLYVAQLQTPAERFDVVVKQFRHDRLKPRLRRAMRGTKAQRSWASACSVLAAGLATPEPVLYADHENSSGPAFYVCRYEPERMEARYLLRALNAGIEAEEFPDLDAVAFLRTLAAALAKMHRANIWHRDMTSGNVLLHRPAFYPAGAAPSSRNCQASSDIPALSLIDLSRARCGPRLSLNERMRDLSRMPILREPDQETFLRSYFEASDLTSGQQARGRKLYRFGHRSFLLKNTTKQRVRGGLRSVAEAVLPRRAAHTHIPDADPQASKRDKIVWDNLSDQPHQHASRFEKTLVRLGDSPRHVGTIFTLARSTPKIRSRFRELQKAPRAGFEVGGFGVALRPFPEDPAGLLAALDDLSVRHVLLRLHPWQEEHQAEESLALALRDRGIELSFSLPQNRELVKDPKRWRESVRRLATTFAPLGQAFQVGQAINRSKWGVWHPGEYIQLLRSANSELRQVREDVQVLGPPIIDFEFHGLAAMLNSGAPDLHFDAVASLLYVDRRGAPENEQMGLDTVGKVQLLKGIAETSKNCPSGSVWITETNWPLREGPHSPAGRDVAVSEEHQADYLVRYFVLVLATGLVHRTFWWQPIARGYGLIDPAGGELRRRASFFAMREVVAQIAGSTFDRRLATEDPAVHLYRFVRPSGRPVYAAWTTDASAQVDRPEDVETVVAINGEVTEAGDVVSLCGRPVFLSGASSSSSVEPNATALGAPS